VKFSASCAVIRNKKQKDIISLLIEIYENTTRILEKRSQELQTSISTMDIAKDSMNHIKDILEFAKYPLELNGFNYMRDNSDKGVNSAKVLFKSLAASPKLENLSLEWKFVKNFFVLESSVIETLAGQTQLSSVDLNQSISKFCKITALLNSELDTTLKNELLGERFLLSFRNLIDANTYCVSTLKLATLEQMKNEQKTKLDKLSVILRTIYFLNLLTIDLIGLLNKGKLSRQNSPKIDPPPLKEGHKSRKASTLKHDRSKSISSLDGTEKDFISKGEAKPTRKPIPKFEPINTENSPPKTDESSTVLASAEGTVFSYDANSKNWSELSISGMITFEQNSKGFAFQIMKKKKQIFFYQLPDVPSDIHYHKSSYYFHRWQNNEKEHVGFSFLDQTQSKEFFDIVEKNIKQKK